MSTTSSNFSSSTTRPESARVPNWVLPAATVAVLALAYGPLLAVFFVQQWARPHYQYFPFVLGAFLWLLWRNSARAERRKQSHSRLRRFGVLALVLTSWSLLVVAYLAASPWLAVVSGVLLVAGLFVGVAGRWRVEYLWGIWALLWLVVPLPLNRDQDLIVWLQAKSSRLSSIFLDTVGVAHLMEGNTLVLPEKQLLVDEACSGIVSALAIIACAVIYGVWRNRPPLHVALLTAAGVGWATLMNVVRITLIAIAFAKWGVDWSSGTSHEILGLVIFTFIFLALVGTDYLFLGLLAPIVPRGRASVGEPIRVGAKVVTFWDWLQTWGTPRTTKCAGEETMPKRRAWDVPSQFALGVVPLLAFVTLSGAQLALPFWFRDPPALTTHGLDRALALDAAAMPTRIGPLQMTKFRLEERHRDDIMGQYSRIYEFRDGGGNDYLASCDFPFSTWHDLAVCYKGIGWIQQGGATVHKDADAGEESWDFVEADFTKPDGSAAHLVYSVFDEYGRPVTAPRHSILSDIQFALERQRRTMQAKRVFQIQVWTTAAGSVGERQREAARTLLLQAREIVRRSITQSAATPVLKPQPNQNR